MKYSVAMLSKSKPRRRKKTSRSKSKRYVGVSKANRLKRMSGKKAKKTKRKSGKKGFLGLDSVKIRKVLYIFVGIVFFVGCI